MEETEKKLLVSRIQTPDGTILTSRHRHDYVKYTDKNGLEYMLDGGNDYQRVIVNNEAPHKDVSIYEDDPFEEIRKYYSYGYKINDDDDIKEQQILCEVSTKDIIEHLHYMKYYSKISNILCLKELLYRIENNIE